MTSNNTTAVIFRKWPASDCGGGIIALFPYIPGTRDPSTCQSFEHVGQHAPANLSGVISRTQPATPGEYEALKNELERAPYSYTLTVCERVPRDARGVRAAGA